MNASFHPVSLPPSKFLPAGAGRVLQPLDNLWVQAKLTAGSVPNPKIEGIKKMKKLLLVIGIVCLMATNALATDVFTSGTLASLIALGDTGITIGDKQFYDFGYTGSSQGGATAITAAGITVTAITTPNDPGLQFNAAWTVGANQILDSGITFKVQVLPGGNAIEDVNASMTGFDAIPAGIVGVAETFSLEPSNTVIGSLGLFSDGTTSVSYDEKFLTPTLGILDVTKDISVNGNSLGIGNFATVSFVDDQFSEVPVPPSVLLLGSGLLGLVGFGWRKRS